MDLGQTGAALEHEWHLGFGKEFENHAAEVIFLDETREESSFLGGKLDGGAQIFGSLLVPANGHGHASPFQITPQRASTVPRFGRRGIHGIGPVVEGRRRSSKG